MADLPRFGGPSLTYYPAGGTLSVADADAGKNVRTALVAALLVPLAVPQAWAVSTDIYAVCNLNPNGDNFLALRERPTAQSRMIMELPPGTQLEEWERSGNWMKVDVLIDGRPSGYVYADYTCLIEDH